MKSAKIPKVDGGMRSPVYIAVFYFAKRLGQRAKAAFSGHGFLEENCQILPFQQRNFKLHVSETRFRDTWGARRGKPGNIFKVFWPKKIDLETVFAIAGSPQSIAGSIALGAENVGKSLWDRFCDTVDPALWPGF